MRYVFWGLIGLVVLGVLVVGGGAYWLSNVEVDFNNPQMVAKFKETYTDNCVATYRKQLAKAGKSAGEDELTKVQGACDCTRDPVVEALAQRPVMTVSELAGTIADDPVIAKITRRCSKKFGIENPS